MRQRVISRLVNFFKKRAFQYEIEIVFLYGSLASGYPHAGSDVDLGIVFSENIDNPGKIHFFITEITYELSQELNKEVNAISLSSNFSHPMLYYNVIVLGIPIFIKDNDRFLKLKLEALHQMEDFQLFGIPWQHQIAHRIIEEVV